MLIKGIKRGNTIELIEPLDIPDGQEIILEIQGDEQEQKKSVFWETLAKFRLDVNVEALGIDNEAIFGDVRDLSPGREVIL